MTDAADSEAAALAAGYVRYAQSLRHDDDPDAVCSPETDPDRRAYELVDQAIKHGPAARAWTYSVAVLARAPDAELGAFAAGPLEDCLRIHGAALVEQIEREAAAHERFRWALGTIWLSEHDLPPDVLRRIVRASADAIKVLEWLPRDGSSGRSRDVP